MKIFGIVKNFLRNVQTPPEKTDPSTPRTFKDYVRYFLFGLLLVYFLMIFPPIANLRIFLPDGIEQSKKFLLFVAHPDDECLFFSPTILGLIARNKLGHIVVISTGNSQGLGPLREKELIQSCEILNIPPTRCLALNITNMQDDPKHWWPKDNLSQIIDHYIKSFQADLVITFDRGGISGHVNHRSIAWAMEYYISQTKKTPLIYQLSTVSSLFEYTSIVDLFRTLLKFLPRIFRWLLRLNNDYRVLFVNSPWKYVQALRAFHAHRSQVLWYRHLYTSFSRHMFINDLIQISPC